MLVNQSKRSCQIGDCIESTTLYTAGVLYENHALKLDWQEFFVINQSLTAQEEIELLLHAMSTGCTIAGPGYVESPPLTPTEDFQANWELGGETAWIDYQAENDLFDDIDKEIVEELCQAEDEIASHFGYSQNYSEQSSIQVSQTGSIAGPATLRGTSVAAALQKAESKVLLLRGINISGSVNVGGLQQMSTISFTQCDIERGIWFENSSVSSLTIDACNIGTELTAGQIYGINSKAGSIHITDTKIALPMNFYPTMDYGFRWESGEIKSDLTIRESRLDFVSLDDSKIDADIDFYENNVLYFSFNRTHFRSELKLYHDQFRLEIEKHGFNLVGIVQAESAHFDRSVHLSCINGAHMSNCHFEGDLLIDDSLEKSLLLSNSIVNGSLILPRAKFPSATVDISGSRIFDLCFKSNETEDKEPIIDSVAVRATHRPYVERVSLWDSEHTEKQEGQGLSISIQKTQPVIFADNDRILFETLKFILSGDGPSVRFNPFVTLAISEALRNAGQVSEAKDLEMFSIDQQLGAKPGWRNAIWRWISQVTVGHGFKRFRIFWFILLIWILATVVTASFSSSFQAAPNVTSDPPGFWSGLYALDVVVSPIGTGQSEYWSSNLWGVNLVLWFLRVVAWGLGALFVADLAGWTNRGLIQPSR